MAHVSSLTPPRGLARRWLLALRNVGIGALLLAATLLVLGFLTLTSAHAQSKPELRIGYQKSASLFVLQKAQGTLEKSLAPLGFGVKWVEFPAGPQLLEGLNVGAVDVGYVGEAPPIFAQAAEKATGARVLADGTGVVNNYQYYLGERGFVRKNPKVIQALFDDSVTQGIWLKKNLRQAAEIIAPLQGLPVDVVELALRRYAFNVKPLTPEVVADQQRIADTFYALKLIPKAIQVREAVIVPQP